VHGGAVAAEQHGDGLPLRGQLWTDVITQGLAPFDDLSDRFVPWFVARVSRHRGKRDITDAGGRVGSLPAEKNRARYLISPSGHRKLRKLS
jgi:hypothetical protein